jgi:RNA polymerase sigma factor (TIGR02999 family)
MDESHARDALFATLYDELHALARREVRRQGAESPLSATTLLHEAYLAFARRDGTRFPDQAHFLAYAARAMRGVLIDRVRARQAQKRGGGMRETTLDASHAGDIDDADELLALDEALEELATLDSSLARVVDLKFFCGLTFAEIAAVQQVTERTVQRHWEKARLLLRAAMRSSTV